MYKEADKHNTIMHKSTISKHLQVLSELIERRNYFVMIAAVCTHYAFHNWMIMMVI